MKLVSPLSVCCELQERFFGVLKRYARLTNHHEANVLCDVFFRYRMTGIANHIYNQSPPNVKYGAGINELQAVDVVFSAEFAKSKDTFAFLLFNAEYLIYCDLWFEVEEDGSLRVKLSDTHQRSRPINVPPVMNDFWMSQSDALLRTKHFFYEILFCNGCQFPIFSKSEAFCILRESEFEQWRPCDEDKQKALKRIKTLKRHESHMVRVFFSFWICKTELSYPLFCSL